MKDTKQTLLIKEAYRRGYRVTEKGDILNPSNKQRKATPNASGYYHFSMRLNGITSNIPLHRLQAYQKFGDSIFEKGIVVRHYNGNCLDNSKGNILIGTHSDNMMDKPKEQRISCASNPTYNHKSILEDRSNGMNYKEIMLKHNIPSKGTVSFIINKSLEKDKNISL